MILTYTDQEDRSERLGYAKKEMLIEVDHLLYENERRTTRLIDDDDQSLEYSEYVR